MGCRRSITVCPLTFHKFRAMTVQLRSQLAGRDKNVAVSAVVPQGVTAAELEVGISLSLADAETEIGVHIVEVRDGRIGETRKQELAIVAVVDPMERKIGSS